LGGTERAGKVPKYFSATGAEATASTTVRFSNLCVIVTPPRWILSSAEREKMPG
jgi:hypothetical protein